VQTLTKQELRTKETRARLLDAAEAVFVRDGYESAQLDAIAATAERSKGAVYTHFKSKEDLFLALFEDRTSSYIVQLVRSLKKCTHRKQSLKTFRDFYVGLLRDTAWSILTLEFKLYALRHPESKERLRRAFEMSKAMSDSATFDRMFGHLTAGQRGDIESSLSALGPVLSGLILESHFEPDILSKKALRRLLGKIFDALVPSHP
jgi:AcrR family transcriptional regulator